MSTDDTLKAGIAALNAGRLAQAAALFAEVLEIEPQSEQAWLGLGFSVTAPDQREYCFRRVLAINPNNHNAREQLGRSSRPNPVPPAQSRTPAFVETSTPGNESTPVKPPTRLDTFSASTVHPESQELPAPQFDQMHSKAASTKQAAGRKKKSNTRLMIIFAIISVPLLIICGLGIGYVFTYLNTQTLPVAQQPPLSNQASAQPNTTTSPAPISTTSTTPNPPTPVPSPVPTVAYTPTFENAECQFKAPAANVNCGYLVVPEDRTGDPSHTIKLAVAVYHSKNSKPAEPVIFLQGGPGAEAVKLSADAYTVLVAPFLSKRDFVTFDQRGTGLSQPALNCDDLTKFYSQDIHGLIPDTTRSLVYSNALLSCNGLMQAQGIHLKAYTTVESAADVRDLLAALKYPKADLYGASYGTRLAQVVMRDYPGIVNSAILDSVVPVDTSLFSNYSNSIESGLKTLFTDCTNDPQCNSSYPNLESTFWDLVKQLDAKPVTVTSSDYPTGTITQSVTGETVLNIILGSIKDSQFIVTAPQSIYRFKGGDFSTLVISQSSLPFEFEGISPGLFINMTCHEQVLSTTPGQAQTDANLEIIKDYAWLPFYGDIADVFKTCNSWGAVPPAYGENSPTVSDIPSLIITGSFDPTTPPVYARQVASHLSHSFYFEFPNLGHTPTAADTTGCAMGIAVQFLNNPSVEPDRSCMSKLKKTVFIVPYTGTPALALKTVSSQGMSYEVPKDWRIDITGFYARGNSPFDTTEVGLVKGKASTSDIEKSFSLKAFGYQGLDGPLTPAGERHANGLNWKLYTSTSYGHPVDIAMADRVGGSMVAMQICNQDEHDALYRTVFLPLIDSAR